MLYAVKCNPHPLVLRALYDAGIHHFDTASLPEIALVRESLPDAACYFMHPVKGRAVIGTSSRVYNIDNYVIDHPKELEKILDETDGGEGLTIFVRIATPPVEGTLYHLAAKFGAELDEAAAMLKEAKSRGCQVGLAFHVGSQCLSPEAYGKAIDLAGTVVEKAKIDIAALDIGGGFPAKYVGTNMPALEDYMTAIEEGAKRIKLRRDCVLMCEPGRALVAAGVSLITQVQLRKDDKLYINDGIYGALERNGAGRGQAAGAHVAPEGRAIARIRGFLPVRPDLRFARHPALQDAAARRHRRGRLDRDRLPRRLFQRQRDALQRLPQRDLDHGARPSDRACEVMGWTFSRTPS